MTKIDSGKLRPGGVDGVHLQYGALCWRLHRAKVEVLLITSRDTGRWVIPKGWPMEGLSPEAAAGREAWEEAGVEGTPDTTCAGVYTYQKVLCPNEALPCAVAVYGMRVARLTDRFPERKQRRRKWFVAEKAARKVHEAELRDLILAFQANAISQNAATPPVAGPATPTVPAI